MARLQGNTLDRFMEDYFLKTVNHCPESPVKMRSAERRSNLRIPAEFGIDCVCSGRTSSMTTIDLSNGGLSIESFSPPIVGERAYMYLNFPGVRGAPVPRVIGQVVWSKRSVGGAPGRFGVSFFAVQAEARYMMDAFLGNA